MTNKKSLNETLFDMIKACLEHNKSGYVECNKDCLHCGVLEDTATDITTSIQKLLEDKVDWESILEYL